MLLSARPSRTTVRIVANVLAVGDGMFKANVPSDSCACMRRGVMPLLHISRITGKASMPCSFRQFLDEFGISVVTAVCQCCDELRIPFVADLIDRAENLCVILRISLFVLPWHTRSAA